MVASCFEYSGVLKRTGFDSLAFRFKFGGIMKHIIKEGSRHHVTFWDSNGIHCSEKECELNHLTQKVRIPTNLNIKEDNLNAFFFNTLSF